MIVKEINYKKYCIELYNKRYNEEYLAINSRDEVVREREAQKKAIRDTIINAMSKYPAIEPANLWKCIYSAHVNRKSGISDVSVINSVISSDNSWKKSSGHAFEDVVKTLSNKALQGTHIKIHLQREINTMISNKEIDNPSRDINWLKSKIKSSTFDLYSTIEKNGKKYVFGCIQSKSSIRDRVTRDREPSIDAMNHYFWSCAIVLDGDFLRLPKFLHMVNGNSEDYSTNGWHAMYVFSKNYDKGRIHPIGADLKTFIEHTKKASEFWLTERQWLDSNWNPTESQ